MNENLDLTKILEGCPEGYKLYSPLFGEVEFVGIVGYVRPIVVKVQTQAQYNFSKEGYYFDYYQDEECLLFPSKEQRDWSKFERFWNKTKVERFDINTLQPFDKIIARDRKDQVWTCDMFSYICNKIGYLPIIAIGDCYRWCIPYNDETKNLVGTTDDCPEYYKWWEE